MGISLHKDRRFKISNQIYHIEDVEVGELDGPITTGHIFIYMYIYIYIFAGEHANGRKSAWLAFKGTDQYWTYWLIFSSGRKLQMEERIPGTKTLGAQWQPRRK